MTNIASTYSQRFDILRIIEAQKNQLNIRQSEIASGRKSDLALSLGAGMRRSLNAHSLLNSCNKYREYNNIVKSRLQITQTCLSNIYENADDYRSSLMMAANDARDQKIIVAMAKQKLDLFTSSLNSSFDNKYIFGGERTDIPPLNEFLSEQASPIKLAINDAFSRNPPIGFGFSQTSSLVPTISPEQLENFINGSLSQLFTANEWSKSWSSASNQPLKNMISPGHLIDTSTTTNEPAMRKIAMAYVIGCNLGAENMNATTYQTLSRKATEILDEGLKLLNSTRSRIGVMQQTIDETNISLQKQSNILEININEIEGVDQTEMATITADLLSRIEATMTLASRISNLSLARFL